MLLTCGFTKLCTPSSQDICPKIDVYRHVFVCRFVDFETSILDRKEYVFLPWINSTIGTTHG
jgi:hypothetical protein